MTTGATGQLGLALPVQGELSGSWGNTVNNGITEYTNIAIAATLTLTNDGAVTLANTTGDASASNIVSSLTGAGTVTAQFAIVRVTGTLTTAKVVTAPSYSKTYTVVNAATGGIVTFKASGQTGVSIAVGESAFVYYNGTDYVKVSSTVATGVTSFTAGTTGLTPSTATTGAVTLAGTLAVANGGTGQTSYTNGQLLIGNSSGNTLAKATLTAGTGISISNGAGAITITNSAGSPSEATTTTPGTVRAFTPNADFPTSYATFLGYLAGQSLSSGIHNTLIGYEAGKQTSQGSYKIAIGNYAGYTETANPYQAQMVAIGYYSLNVSTGTRNVAIGNTTGSNLTTGNNNTFAGHNAGTSLTTGANNIIIGYDADSTTATVSNEVTIGNASVTAFRIPGLSLTWNTTSGLNSLGVGTPASGTAGEIRATNNITAYYSDDRLKKRLGGIENALDKVRTLDSFYYEANETAQELGYEPIREVGISAQQVQAVLPEVVVPAPISDKYLTVRYERLVPLLIAAIKELEAKVKLLEAK